MRLPVTLWHRLVKARQHTAFITAGIPLNTLAFCCALLIAPTPLLSTTQRHRFGAMLGVDIPPPAADTEEEAGPGQVRAWLRSKTTWRQSGYHLVTGPLMALGAVGVLLLWFVALAAVSVLLWIWALPTEWRITHRGYMSGAVYVTAIGVILLAFAVWLSGALVRVDAYAAWLLLGPNRTEQMRRRIEDLSHSRAGVVDATDLERRRIERDLHDGAQQRLVSMAVNLGLAKAALTDLPKEAYKVIDEAHREAKEAIEELSSLVRGLHPAVLEDRGLDAALSGIAARVPVPVRMRVSLPNRPSPTIEAVAYFVVSESLTNVVKHAQASEAQVDVEQASGTLRIAVTDDGRGRRCVRRDRAGRPPQARRFCRRQVVR